MLDDYKSLHNGNIRTNGPLCYDFHRIGDNTMIQLQNGDIALINGYKRNTNTGSLERFPVAYRIDYISNNGSIRGTDHRGRLSWFDWRDVLKVKGAR